MTTRWCATCRDYRPEGHPHEPTLFDVGFDAGLEVGGTTHVRESELEKRETGRPVGTGGDFAREREPWHTLTRPMEVVDARVLARDDDPETSKAAARALGGKAGTMRRRLLEAFAVDQRLGFSGLTAERAAESAGYGPEDGPWKRVSDLLDAKLLEETGETRPGTSGRAQRVLRISEAGRRALRAGDADPG